MSNLNGLPLLAWDRWWQPRGTAGSLPVDTLETIRGWKSVSTCPPVTEGCRTCRSQSSPHPSCPHLAPQHSHRGRSSRTAGPAAPGGHRCPSPEPVRGQECGDERRRQVPGPSTPRCLLILFCSFSLKSNQKNGRKKTKTKTIQESLSNPSTAIAPMPFVPHLPHVRPHKNIIQGYIM